MSDNNAINEKKKQSGIENDDKPDFKSFASNYLSSIIFTIGFTIFIIGGIGLYTTKIAQANILPENINFAPFTDLDREVKDMPININIMRPSFFSENKDTFSQKAIFDSTEYLDSFNNSFLCYVKKSANPNIGFLANAPLFFSHVYENLVAKNFMVINFIFFYLSYLPESIIMLLYGVFGIFLWFGLYFFNICISIFYHLINIPQLFRDVSETNKNEWETNDKISFLRIVKLILFFFIWIPIGFFSAFILPIILTVYGLISPLFATYKIIGKPKIVDNAAVSYNLFDFIKDTFAYKKYFFLILATFSLFYNGTKHLGNNSIIGIIIAVFFAYVMGLYTNNMPIPEEDGFTAKIRLTPKQSPVILKGKNKNIRKVCKPTATEEILENTETPVINESETPIINENEVPIINENEVPVINENEAPVINEAPINENEVPINNENEAPVINEAPINENEVPINENEVPINEVPINEVPVINENEVPINENEVPVINENKKEKYGGKSKNKSKIKKNKSIKRVNYFKIEN